MNVQDFFTSTAIAYSLLMIATMLLVLIVLLTSKKNKRDIDKRR